MSVNSVTALQVTDEDFLVASLIERCPKPMMLRELMMNALEAARHAPVDQKIIEIRSLDFNGVSKLAIWNTGPGMDAAELLHISNIASSIGKEKSLTGNFWDGCEGSFIALQPGAGMQYRSCKDGRVHQVILCKRDGVYRRLRIFHPDTNEYHEVVDVTEIAEKEHSLLHDWTEVVLFGNDADPRYRKGPLQR